LLRNKWLSLLRNEWLSLIKIIQLAIGRKNYLFCGNAEAAIRASVIYSLIGSCKAAGVNPTEWLEDVLSKIYSYSNGKGNLEDLLPHQWRKNQTCIM